MKKAFKTALAVVAGLATIANVAVPSLAHAAPYKSEGRTMYTKAQINEMANNGTWAADKIVFNSIKDNDALGDEEKNFVGARECTLLSNGRCEGNYKTNKWYSNVEVEDGKTYIVRLYVHNNNPYGKDAAKAEAGTAKNVSTSFIVPYDSAKTVRVDGYIHAPGTVYETYLDSVNFSSKTGNPFHLEYVGGSALFENNHFTSGTSLSDRVVNTANGALIGYNKLDGRVPGCFDFDGIVTIQVKAVYDYDFAVNKMVRLADSEDKTWYKYVDAKVGDTVEFMIHYDNISNYLQNDVGVRDYLPKNLEYIQGSTLLYTGSLNGVTMNSNNITNGGIPIGSFNGGADAFVVFRAKVIDNSLACGDNSLVNWAQVSVGDTSKEAHATVGVAKECEIPDEPTEEPEPETPTVIPNTGPEAIAGGVIATGSIVTAAGYYIASRRQLRK